MRKPIELKGQIVHVNNEIMCIYTNCDLLILRNEDEYNNLLMKEKFKIAAREYILDRFEHWEVNNEKQLKNILLSRARNNSEKELVRKYISHLTGE